ncbi:uncharacterized protein LOC124483360 [Hypomesus transpacificus]|uniref:uncharacterized protein LOC124483360 n=1 Tax=Hypomesus transpacificus TaxID=137520 RepID=UPI001F077424|nr:uncharacterized protein LOC124483360 [Hypomesus transpacificus]
MIRGGKTGRGSRAAGGREPRPEPNKPTEADLVVEDEATGMVTSAEDEEGREPTIADLASILRAHMGQQHGREVRLKQEAERQEQRFKALQHQFGLLQLEVEARTSPDPEPCGTSAKECSEQDSSHPGAHGVHLSQGEHTRSGQSRFLPEPRLEKLTELDDVEHFLTTFERIAVACRWPRLDWAFRLIPLLTGKARSAYVHMDMDDALDYEMVKSAILKKYDINPETYRQGFRSLEVESEENPKELYVRLKGLYGKWVQPKGKSGEEIGEILILEQFLNTLSPELQVWVREHDPRTAAEAAALADVFVAARGKDQPWSFVSWKTGRDHRRPWSSQPDLKSTTDMSTPFAKENRPVQPPFRADGETANLLFVWTRGPHQTTMPPERS